jgi:hypothetical protein
MSSSVTPPIPRQPTGATFLVAITLLGIFALFQLAAVGWHFLPVLRAQILENRQERPEAAAGDDVAAAATPAGPVATTQGAAPVDPAIIARATQIISEVDRNFRVGDFDAALQGLQQAEVLAPSNPAILFRFGQVYEALDDKAQAFMAYERSILMPGLPSDVRRQAEQKMALLAQVLGEQEAGIPGARGTPVAPAPAADAGGQPVRDEIGLQPGASLGIVSTRLVDSQPGAKTLSIAVKSRPGTSIDAGLMNVHVFFYEQDENGEVLVTQSRPATQWISPPVDWADGEPELLEVEYPLPDGGLPGSSADLGAVGRTYYGYIVGVYYGGELQDSRADPGRLNTLFPMALYLDNTNAP